MRNLRVIIAKPGLDGHSNGAEQIAVRAKDVGMEVIYQGIRLTPEQIAKRKDTKAKILDYEYVLQNPESNATELTIEATS